MVQIIDFLLQPVFEFQAFQNCPEKCMYIRNFFSPDYREQKFFPAICEDQRRNRKSRQLFDYCMILKQSRVRTEVQSFRIRYKIGLKQICAADQAVISGRNRNAQVMQFRYFRKKIC